MEERVEKNISLAKNNYHVGTFIHHILRNTINGEIILQL